MASRACLQVPRAFFQCFIQVEGASAGIVGGQGKVAESERGIVESRALAEVDVESRGKGGESLFRGSDAYRVLYVQEDAQEDELLSCAA